LSKLPWGRRGIANQSCCGAPSASLSSFSTDNLLSSLTTGHFGRFTSPEELWPVLCGVWREGTINDHRANEGGAMNKDHFKAQWNQFKGELKKQWGQFTDDDLLQIEGDADTFAGKMQERYADKKDEVRRWADQWLQSREKKVS
jgi:uncharacterized protein YjbJ (UPF0337 family)